MRSSDSESGVLVGAKIDRVTENMRNLEGLQTLGLAILGDFLVKKQFILYGLVIIMSETIVITMVSDMMITKPY